MTILEKSLIYSKYLFIPRFRFFKKLVYFIPIYIIFHILIAYTINLNNSSLEYKEGIVDYIYIKTAYESDIDYKALLTIKLKDSDQLYGQKIDYPNFFLIHFFLFGKSSKPFAHNQKLYKDGDRIGFYVDNHHYINNVLKMVDTKVVASTIQQSNSTKILVSYGLIVDNTELINYKKRGLIYSSTLYRLLYIPYILIGLALIFSLVNNFLNSMQNLIDYKKKRIDFHI